MKKTTILIDGQNLFYSLKDINIQEKSIRWDLFLKSLLKPDEDELLRTYWFRPLKILDTFYNPQFIKSQIIYKSYPTYRCNHIQIPPNIMQEIDQKVNEVEKWIQSEKSRFSQIEYNYDQIALTYDDIEIVKTGIVKINPFIQQYICEKGVDVALSVKMISLSVEKKCDKIILISGDYDYAEAIKFVKNNMTKIHIVKIHKGHPPKNKSVSRDLAVLADKIIDVYEEDIKSKFVITP